MFSILGQNRPRGWQTFEKKNWRGVSRDSFFSKFCHPSRRLLKIWSRQIMFYTKSYRFPSVLHNKKITIIVAQNGTWGRSIAQKRSVFSVRSSWKKLQVISDMSHLHFSILYCQPSWIYLKFWRCVAIYQISGDIVVSTVRRVWRGASWSPYNWPPNEFPASLAKLS